MTDLEYEETIAQPYANCRFSAGFVEGHEVDTLYLKFARDDEEPTTILLRPDEAAALAWCLTGVLWSERMRLDSGAPRAEETTPQSVFVQETTLRSASLPEEAQKYVREVPEIATVIHKGLPLAE